MAAIDDAGAVMEMRMDDQERSTKAMKEDSAVVGSGNVDGTKAAAVAGAGNKAAAAKTKPEGAKKRTKTMRVNQGYIDFLLERYPFRPFPVPGDPEELEKNIPNPVKREELRIILAPATALMKASRDKNEAIIKQYLAQGYAEEEVEVSDDEA